MIPRGFVHPAPSEVGDGEASFAKPRRQLAAAPTKMANLRTVRLQLARKRARACECI